MSEDYSLWNNSEDCKPLEITSTMKNRHMKIFEETFFIHIPVKVNCYIGDDGITEEGPIMTEESLELIENLRLELSKKAKELYPDRIKE